MINNEFTRMFIDKKNLVIAVLIVVILALGVFTFGIRGPDYQEIKQRIDSSIERVTDIKKSAEELQIRNAELIKELARERDISDGLQKTSDRFEQLYNESEQRYREQRKIIERISSGDIETDGTINRISRRINSAIKLIGQLRAGE